MRLILTGHIMGKTSVRKMDQLNQKESKGAEYVKIYQYYKEGFFYNDVYFGWTYYRQNKYQCPMCGIYYDYGMKEMINPITTSVVDRILQYSSDLLCTDTFFAHNTNLNAIERSQKCSEMEEKETTNYN